MEPEGLMQELVVREGGLVHEPAATMHRRPALVVRYTAAATAKKHEEGRIPIPTECSRGHCQK